MRWPRVSRTLLLLVLALTTAGCSVFSSDNRRLLNLLDEHWAPSSAAARWALAPVAAPVGITGLAIDALIVHPLSAIDDAWADTEDLLWSQRQESGLRTAVVTPLAALATPVVFGAAWIGRSLLPIQAREDSE